MPSAFMASRSGRPARLLPAAVQPGAGCRRVSAWGARVKSRLKNEAMPVGVNGFEDERLPKVVPLHGIGGAVTPRRSGAYWSARGAEGRRGTSAGSATDAGGP
jgi:hypothetical protein